MGKKLVTLLIAAGWAAMPVTAGVIAAWDFNISSNTVSTGWTTFVLGSSAADTVHFTGDDVLGDGSVTLTQAATGDWTNRSNKSVFTLTNAPVLLAAAADIHDDGFDLSGTQDFTLSGLVEGQEYRLQFVGVIRYTDFPQNRNLNMTSDITGLSSASLFNTADTNIGYAAGYSEYLEFTADGSGDVVITFGEVSSGQKIVGGLVVEAIADSESVEPPVIIGQDVQDGTNMLLTWTSAEGLLYDLWDSADLSGWSNRVKNIPTSTAVTQTSHAVSMNADADRQFFRVQQKYSRLPNIIILFADDLGYGDLACYGHPYAKTPNLDRLAEQGTLFRKFNVTGKTCNPSRVGLLTSWTRENYPESTVDYGFNQYTDYNGTNPITEHHVDRPTIMQLLKEEAGYRTGHFGKWHIGDVHEYPEGTTKEEWGSLSKTDPVSGTYGIDKINVMGGSGPLGRDQTIYQAAIDFITDNYQTNFYLNVMGRVTHNPVDPDPQLVTNANFHTLVVNRSDFSGQQIQDMFDAVEAAAAGDQNINTSMANYLTEVYYLDHFVGELLDKLDELGIADNTIIAFSSDQGAALVNDVEGEDYRTNRLGWSGGLRGQKHSEHEGGIRSPFILRWPGYVPAGKVNTESTTSALDWLPTLCEIAGIDISTNGLDVDVLGESVLDIWKGSDRSRADPQFWPASMKKDEWRAYFENAASTNMVELFDLSTDFAETNNLVGVRSDIVAELTPIWTNWQASLP